MEGTLMYTAQTAADYIRIKLPGFFGEAAELIAHELSDGNINYVFRVEDRLSGKSLIIKHAEDTLRVNTERHIGFERSRIECEVLKMQREHCPDLIPEVYLYDEDEHNIVMQDMRGYENLRYELCDHRIFPHLAEDIADFCGKALIGSTDMIIGAGRKKDLVKRYTNPNLCEITERHVLTEPYFDDLDDNSVMPDNEDILQNDIYGNEDLKARVGMLKAVFETKAQALIHGDLHSGSIFVTPEATCILDPEFAFYGPIGYDTGNFIANMIFAYANALYTMEDGSARNAYLEWILGTIESFCDDFSRNARQMLMNGSDDRMMHSGSFCDLYLDDIFRDQAGFTGTELIRRIVGTSKVRDITSIADERARTKAELFCIRTGICFVMEADTMMRGRDYTDRIKWFTDLLDQ